jgi:serine/threonine protein kinase
MSEDTDFRGAETSYGAEPEPGSVFAERYEILEVLGQGAMGRVYGARDMELGREVALKLVPWGLVKDRRAVRALKKEALAGIELSHPNIVRVFHWDEYAGRPYIVMEWVRGRTLLDVLSERGGVEEEQAVDWGLQICRALSHAHGRGMIHRDIKPANVMVTAGGVVRVMDFGIARVATDEAVASGSVSVVGTLGYMAPEQIRGGKVDGRTDIYAVGVLLYELVSGRRPFDRGDVAYQHLHEAPQRPRGMGEGLWRVVSRCLEKEPGARFPSAEALEEALGQLAGASRASPVRSAAGKPLGRSGNWRDWPDRLWGMSRTASVRRVLPRLRRRGLWRVLLMAFVVWLAFRVAPRLTESARTGPIVESRADRGNESALGERPLSPGTVRTFEIYPGVSMEFVWIPPGTFRMGSPADELGHEEDEGPLHEVRITKGFWLGRYEVTQGQWEPVMGSNPSYFLGEDRPVDSVSWTDVHDFIAKLNSWWGEELYRLPTEAEWEYACRAGTRTRFNFGTRDSQLGDFAWYGGNSGSKTHPVGRKRPNRWGLHDLLGNVWEWCQDWYDPRYYNTGPSGQVSTMVLHVRRRLDGLDGA